MINEKTGSLDNAKSEIPIIRSLKNELNKEVQYAIPNEITDARRK